MCGGGAGGYGSGTSGARALDTFGVFLHGPLNTRPAPPVGQSTVPFPCPPFSVCVVWCSFWDCAPAGPGQAARGSAPRASPCPIDRHICAGVAVPPDTAAGRLACKGCYTSRICPSPSSCNAETRSLAWGTNLQCLHPHPLAAGCLSRVLPPCVCLPPQPLSDGLGLGGSAGLQIEVP